MSGLLFELMFDKKSFHLLISIIELTYAAYGMQVEGQTIYCLKDILSLKSQSLDKSFQGNQFPP